ncbi:diguanylate phosphodiesterase [Sulfobacillus sp. hq2]|nr:diguanylate phosphodiesterase [Sulfobacillus sp. hq2]
MDWVAVPRRGHVMNSKDAAQQALVAALRRGDIRAVFQPIWTIQGQCVGFEALSRFANGCPPDRVWDYAERVHQVMRLDRIAIQQAVRSAYGLMGKLFLNIRAVHLTAASTLPFLGSPNRIIWEITESQVADQDGASGSLWLRQQGYALALDDAGSGCSTPHRLDWLRPQIVKIDSNVVQEWAQGSPEGLRRWIAAARAIHAVVVAEGVEERAWLEGLAREGIEAVQGYALGRPASAPYWRAHTSYDQGQVGLS